MLPATPEETQAIVDYMSWQAPDLKVEFLQKGVSLNKKQKSPIGF
jgi:hypothetical protein